MTPPPRSQRLEDPRERAGYGGVGGAGRHGREEREERLRRRRGVRRRRRRSRQIKKSRLESSRCGDRRGRGSSRGVGEGRRRQNRPGRRGNRRERRADDRRGGGSCSSSSRGESRFEEAEGLGGRDGARFFLCFLRLAFSSSSSFSTFAFAFLFRLPPLLALLREESARAPVVLLHVLVVVADFFVAVFEFLIIVRRRRGAIRRSDIGTRGEREHARERGANDRGASKFSSSFSFFFSAFDGRGSQREHRPAASRQPAQIALKNAERRKRRGSPLLFLSLVSVAVLEAERRRRERREVVASSAFAPVASSLPRDDHAEEAGRAQSPDGSGRG